MGSNGRRKGPGRQSRVSSVAAPVNPNVRRHGPPNMSIDERIAKLNEFRDAVVRWQESGDARERQELRRYINQNRSAVQREVLEARQLKTLTIAPPPAVGGLVMRNVNPFDIMFDPSYLMSLVPHVLDMIDQTIGVMSSTDFETESQASSPVAV